MCSPVEWVRQQARVPQVDLPEGRWLELPGRGRTWLTEAGPADGPPLVLLHALGNTGALNWFTAIGSLAETYRVVTFDQRWHGRGIMSDQFLISDCADDVAAVMDELGFDRPIIAGYSMGGVIAQRVWRQHPDKVGGLVLAATTSHFRSSVPEIGFHQGLEWSMRATNVLSRFAATRSAARRTAKALSVPTTATGQWALAQFNSTHPWTIGQAVASLGRHNSGPWLGSIDVPTAVVVTTNDHVLPPARQRLIAAGIPDATVHEAACGHAGCVMEASTFVPVFRAAVDDVRSRMTTADSPRRAEQPVQS